MIAFFSIYSSNLFPMYPCLVQPKWIVCRLLRDNDLFHLEHGQWWILAKFPFLLKNGFWVEGCVQNYFSFHTWILKKCLLLEKGRMHVEERNRVYQNLCTIFTLVKRDNNQNLLILTIALTQSRYESFIMYIMSIFKSIFPSQTSFKMV